MKRPIKNLLLAAGLAMCAGCTMFTAQERSALRDSVVEAYEQGNITLAQRDAALEAIDRDEPVDWEGLGMFGLYAALALLGAPMVVRWQRGQPTQKVGLPASKVQKAPA